LKKGQAKAGTKTFSDFSFKPLVTRWFVNEKKSITGNDPSLKIGNDETPLRSFCVIAPKFTPQTSKHILTIIMCIFS